MRNFLVIAFLLALTNGAQAADMDALKSNVESKEQKGAPVVIANELKEHVMGDATAPVTLIEYASLTCGHCAHFEKEILPKLAEKYISTGILKLVYRDFPLDGTALKAAQLAQCMPEERYFPFIKTLFETQANWGPSTDVDATLVQYAKLAGLPGERATECLNDKALQEALVKRRMEAEKQFQIDATPTFIVNYGPDKITGASTFEEFDKGLAKYVKDIKPSKGAKAISTPAPEKALEKTPEKTPEKK